MTEKKILTTISIECENEPALAVDRPPAENQRIAEITLRLLGQNEHFSECGCGCGAMTWIFGDRSVLQFHPKKGFRIFHEMNTAGIEWDDNNPDLPVRITPTHPGTEREQ